MKCVTIIQSLLCQNKFYDWKTVFLSKGKQSNCILGIGKYCKRYSTRQRLRSSCLPQNSNYLNKDLGRKLRRIYIYFKINETILGDQFKKEVLSALEVSKDQITDISK